MLAFGIRNIALSNSTKGLKKCIFNEILKINKLRENICDLHSGSKLPIKKQNAVGIYKIDCNGCFIPTLTPLILARRNKSYKKPASQFRGRRVDEDSDDDDDNSDTWILEKGDNFREVSVKVNSLRLDSIVKVGANMSKNKVEEAFYGGKVRVNGEKPKKKSQDIMIEDEIDITLSMEDNNQQIYRIVLLNIGKVTPQKVEVHLRKYPNFIKSKN